MSWEEGSVGQISVQIKSPTGFTEHALDGAARYVCVLLYAYMYECIYVRVCMYACVMSGMYRCVCIYIYVVCVCVFIYIYIYILFLHM